MACRAYQVQKERVACLVLLEFLDKVILVQKESLAYLVCLVAMASLVKKEKQASPDFLDLQDSRESSVSLDSLA